MYYYRISTALIFMSIFVFWEIVFCVMTWQTISAWIVDPTTQALATVPRSLLHDQHTLPPIHRNHPQLQEYPRYLQDTDNGSDSNNRDPYAPAAIFSSDDENRSIFQQSRQNRDHNDTVQEATESRKADTPHRLSERPSQQERRQTTRGRNTEQVSDSSSDDDDSAFDAIVPQQDQHGSSSSVTRVPSGQLRSRKA